MAGPPLNELHRPLGQDAAHRAARPFGRWLAQGSLAVVALAFLGLGGLALVGGRGDGGEPVASAPIRKQIAAAPADPPRPLPPAENPRGLADARQLETEAGVTVVRPGAEAPAAIVISVPDEGGPASLAPAPDPRLVERTRFGILPRVGPDGATAAKIYARPAGTVPARAAGRVAVLIGGLGISQSGTADAIAQLPAPVSLAFAPYGSELAKTVARARADGHEVFLQVPMEPFDYPDNDPGPHTLLTGPRGQENLERLQWALGRFTGYVGIVNFLGGRLTSDDAALSPVLREIAGRGLMVVDDGSSARSLLVPAATRAQIPAVKGDLVLDNVARGDAIDKELQRLETLARERGVAVATASALPVTVERVSRWARTLEAKGLFLVPVSAARAAQNPSVTGSLR